MRHLLNAALLIVLNGVFYACLHLVRDTTPSFLSTNAKVQPVECVCATATQRVKCPPPPTSHPDYKFPISYNIVKEQSGTYLDWVDGLELLSLGNYATRGRISDKVDLRATHEYAPMYQKYLQPMRDSGDNYQMLEIGAGPHGGGRGYLLYRAYAPNIQYHCLEYRNQTQLVLDHPSFTIAEKKYLIDNVYIGDQHNHTDLQFVHDKWGPFDIIIDDGSHFCPNQMQSFVKLFPLLKPGGVYIIEDLQTNFHQFWECGKDQQQRRETVLEMIKELVTALHYHWWQPKEYGQVNFDKDFHLYKEFVPWIQTIDCDREICAIRKRTTKLELTELKEMAA